MTEKITPQHLQRTAYVYVRQSSMGQVRHHRESTERQYALQDRARSFGWLRAGSRSSTETWDVRVRQRQIVATSRHSLPRYRWAMPERFSHWKHRVWPDPTRIGIG